MKEILLYLSISILLFALFLGTLLFGLLKKKRKSLFLAAVLFFAFIGASSRGAYLFLSKSYDRAAAAFKPRTGAEIYSALFGQTNNSCLKVLEYQDQVVPKIDYAILLYAETCPAELRRVLALHDFQAEIRPTQGWKTEGPLAQHPWFKLESLGDSVLVFEYKKDEYGNGQTLYVSRDSTRMFCVDVAD